MKRSIILVTFFALGLLGCSRQSSSHDEPKFITSPGTSEVFGGQVTVAVLETGDGEINYKVTCGPRTAGSSDPFTKRDGPWLIYAASPDAVWMHDGEQNVMLIEISDEVTKITSIEVVPDLLQRAPPPFADRLPSHMKNDLSQQ